MEPYEFIAQAVGIVAMVIGVLSFQQKTQKNIVTMQFCSSILFAVHFGMIGAVIGCILNALGIVRAAVFAQREKHPWAAHICWLYIFSGACVAIYILIFTLLRDAVYPDAPPVLADYIIQLLPVIGMIATTVSFRAKKASAVRALSFVSSPAWLTYNIIGGSVGGSLTEIFVMCSIIIGILRLDRKKQGSEVAQNE